MRLLYTLFLIAFAVVIGVFMYQNNRPVTVSVWNDSHEVSFPLLAIGCYVLGMLSGWTVVGMLRRSWDRATEYRHHS